MSSVIGFAHAGGIVMGSDSIAVDEDGDCYEIVRTTKIFARGPFLFGMVGDFRSMNAIAHRFVPPRKPRDVSVAGFMATAVFDAMREAFTNQGALKDEDGWISIDAAMLVGYRGQLFRISEDLSVIETSTPWDVIGAGTEAARAALSTQASMMRLARNRKRSFEMTPRDRVLGALAAAEAASAKVRRPFIISEQVAKRR